jgi:hypothetical protein
MSESQFSSHASQADDVSVYEAEGGKAKQKRSFTIAKSSTGFSGGRYRGTQPLVAAKKAARAAMKNKGDECTFILRETTRGSDKKEFSYKAMWKKLSTPKPRTLPDGTTLFNQTHEIVIKATKTHVM